MRKGSQPGYPNLRMEGEAGSSELRLIAISGSDECAPETGLLSAEDWVEQRCCNHPAAMGGNQRCAGAVAFPTKGPGLSAC
jgi:hypothetical protein